MATGPRTDRSPERLLHVTLVLRQKGWIFEKITRRLAEHLPHWGVTADIAEAPSSTADFNHFIFLDPAFDESLAFQGNHRSIFVTHVDRVVKQVLLKQQASRAEAVICMSRMTVEQLAEAGIPRSKLCYVTPAHDGTIQPRRLVLGITSRLRSDGAKREDFLLDAAKLTRLDEFHFEIIGTGWERVIPLLEQAGATVTYHPGTSDGLADYRLNIERVPEFDYYLYLGFDEGSYGTLDALAAGVPTIITAQGFHLDIPEAITHPFTNATELAEILARTAGERSARIRSVSQLTWDEYARKHAAIWRAAMDGHLEQVAATLNNPPAGALTLPGLSLHESWRRQYRFWLPPNAEALRADIKRIVLALVGPRLMNRLRTFRHCAPNNTGRR